jgi:hydrogenase/urease accessory protein HupE
MQQYHLRFSILVGAFLATCCASLTPAQAHLLVNNAIDIVVSRNRVEVNTRISLNQLWAVEPHGSGEPTQDQWQAMAISHRAYLLSHLHVLADGHELLAETPTGNALAATRSNSGTNSEMACYTITYPVNSPPELLRISQDCLKEFEPSDASFTLRIRQDDQREFQSAQLHRGGHAEFDCHWNASSPACVQATETHVDLRQNALVFLKQGIWHILTGYDHLLFVSGLVLATSSLWDLVKVVGAFTLAHSLTLMLSVLNIVNLSSRIVEPMISASIMLIALQNIFWPRQSTGWWRVAIAFGFGLFHGLGFAGGLKDAMSELPSTAFWTALLCFSLGVEIGHQIVVLPLYGSLKAHRHFRRAPASPLVPVAFRRWCSTAICVAGGYFLFQALQPGAH